jgi:hypothetical protein
MKASIKKRGSNKKRGGCGCSGSIPSKFFSGGKKRMSRRKIKGGVALGPASLTNYDPSNTYTYSLKDEGLSPLNPSQLTDSRGLPNFFSGGRKSKSRNRNRKSRRHIKRGGGIDPVLQQYSMNPISNFASNTVSGAVTGANIVTGGLIERSSYQMLDAPKPFL